MSYIIYNENCLDAMKRLEDNSVDSIVTDPPYGLSFMGKKWDYDVPSTEIWSECLRVLKPGGHLLAFAGTRTQHRMAVRIEDAGFEIRDMIAWVYGSGFPKSHNLKDEWQGWGTALKPALEPITVARKPLIGTVAETVLAHGTGALNIDGCRVGANAEVIQRGNLDATFTNSAEGYTRANRSMMTHKPKERSGPANENGRWPANLIHDGSDEVVGLFPQSTSTGGDGYKNSIFCGGKKTGGHGLGDSGSASRFFYCAKASKRDRDEGLEGFEVKKYDGRDTQERFSTICGKHHVQRATCGCEHIQTQKNVHPTVKPTDLMRYLCRLVTPPGGVVLDPFTGSGSTGKAAVLEGFSFIGCELSPEYAEIANARIEAALNEKPEPDNQMSLDIG